MFGIDVNGLSDADSPETIPNWDSVAHIQLIMALEAEFDVQFDPDEIGELASVGVIRQHIEATGQVQ